MAGYPASKNETQSYVTGNNKELSVKQKNNNKKTKQKKKQKKKKNTVVQIPM